MRWFHLTVFVLFAALTALFAMQNFQIVPVSFLRIGAEMPFAFLVAVIYLLGAASGSSLFALLRRAMVGARRQAFAT
jgi:uncharacterized integral membrane protein